MQFFKTRGGLIVLTGFLVWQSLIMASCLTAAGQIMPMSFKHLTINDGLSQNTVFCIFQDSKGFIWLGTEDGLNRYDGYEFKVFKNELDKPGSLRNNQVNVIVEDKDHRLIVGTSGGISFFNRDSEDFTNFSIPIKKNDQQASNFVTSIVFRGDEMWVGTFDGLKLFDLKKNKFITADLPVDFGGNIVQTLYLDRFSRLWVAFSDGLRVLDMASNRSLALPLVLQNEMTRYPGVVRVIKEDNVGALWIGSEQSGLFFLSSDKKTCVNYQYDPSNSNGLPINVVRDIYFGIDGKVWIATRKGISLFDQKTNKFITYTNDRYDSGSLSHNSVLRILPDRLGNIWIGTYAGGVNVYNPANLNFSVIGQQMGSHLGLNNPVVSSILHDAVGGLWIGTEGGALNYINKDQNRSISYSLKSVSPPSENIIKSMTWDSKGNIWIGAFDGLYYFENSNKKLSRYPLKKDPAFKGKLQIYALLRDKNGLWIGTNGGGLIYIEPSKEQEHIYLSGNPGQNSLTGNNITCLKKDKAGNLWIATLQGLSKLNTKTGQFTRYVHRANDRYSLTSNLLNCLYFDSKGRFWIGTRGGGINIYDAEKDRFYSFTEKDGLSNNVIRAINEDKKGRIWVSSNKGVSVFSPFGPSPEAMKISVRNYNVSDGLQSNQFLSNASDKLENGQLLFGGINGVSAFFPEQIISSNTVSPIVFTDFLINNKTVDSASGTSPQKKNVDEYRNITLPYNQTYITIKFAMLNYLKTDKNSYAYRLHGFSNDDWHYVDGLRTATYTNLSPGRYIFMVKAANGDGVWNKNVNHIFIKVLPPWYKTWWAYMIYLMVISALLYLFYYFLLKTAKLKNELEFKQMSYEKDQQLSQRQLTFFTHISHEIKTPLTLILSPIEKLLSEGLDNKVNKQLNLIHRNGERLMRLTDQLLDYRKFETGNMKLQAAEGNIIRFIKEIIVAFQSHALSKDILLKVVSEQNSIRVWFDRDKMEKVLYNLISNSLKFTPEGGAIIIQVTKANLDGGDSLRGIRIQIEDNGIGIPLSNLPHIFEQFQHYNTDGVNKKGTGLGLSFSKSLVEMHHGRISVSSRQAKENKGASTIFIIELPLGKDHLSEEEIINPYNNSEDISTYVQGETVKLSEKTVLKKQKILSVHQTRKLIMLIVEDNFDVLDFVASHFAEAFEIVKALDGTEGWIKATESIPDIIISDVMMPGMTGTALCYALKNDERTSHIPIILLTAKDTLFYKVEGLETGADDYIVKPFNLKLLEVRIWNLLESRIKLADKYRREVTLQPTNIAITSVDELFLDKVMHYIEANIADENLGVESLSNEVGMSKATLYRKLKALTNLNSNEFIRSVRINRAGQLLKLKKLNVNEVAYMVGFNDQDYFRKCFKEQFGCTPKVYADRSDPGHS
jgi:ligand-binding sensor domain-containing protein/signal transduction histidine kinase/DNA-binding response OmpR family regulator